MHRQFLQARDAFPKSADEHAQQVLRLLQHRRADMDAKWEELEEGWKANSERMAEVGLRPRTTEESMTKLNVGGSDVTAWWHLLAEAEGFVDSTLGALLEGVWDKERIPRDASGRIVLDESPACINHIMHRMLSGRSNSVTKGVPESAASSAVAFDEAPCLVYTAHVMGLPGYVPTHPTYLKMEEGSTVLEPFEIAPLGAKIRRWVGGSTEQMTLIYRATRDGFDTKSFKPRCNEDSLHTVSLVRVSSGEANDDDSVVGGYSVLPWGSGVERKLTITAETFLFMLKDGSATQKDPSKPIKWNPYPNKVDYTFTINKGYCGACVSAYDLYTMLDAKTGDWTLSTKREMFDIEEESPFLALDGKKVVDVEVYRYSAPAPPSTTAPCITKPDGDALTDAEAHDIDSFGRSIASSLMEERIVLDRAVKEMEAAGARVSAAVGARETLYGPSVAAGEQDTVVELNVRGTRMTTLRSTLQACPRSALAAMFNAERWPATETDKDEHGRRLVDCDPICFSKILDALRIRKRASWSRGVTPEEQEGVRGKCSGAIFVKQADMKAFRTAVQMYFPGCESFIMGLCRVCTTPAAWLVPRETTVEDANDDVVRITMYDVDVHIFDELGLAVSPTLVEKRFTTSILLCSFRDKCVAATVA